MKGLVVDRPWIGYLLDGSKTWEMRSQTTAHRGWVALIAKGSGTVVGAGRLVSVGAPLDEDGMIAAIPQHRIPEAAIRGGEVDKWRIPWIFEDLQPLATPVAYDHPSGAVTWVNLDADVSAAVERQIGRTAAAPPREPDPLPPPSPLASAPLPPRIAVPAPPPAAGERIIGRAPIKAGALAQGYLRVAEILDALPVDVRGGGNEAEAGRPIVVDRGDGALVSTDVAMDKKILRARGWKPFYRRYDAKPDDHVVVAETGPRHYRVWVEAA